MGAKSRTAAACALCALLAGCATTLGSRAVPRASFDYSEAIVRSWNEQLLLNLVRLRYRDTPLFLEVDSVVTQYSFGAGAQASLTLAEGAGDEGEAGAGVDYQERPTVTYEPLQGEAFVKRLLEPISPATIILLSQSGWSIERLLRCCVQQVNNLLNLHTVDGPVLALAERYDRFRELAQVLRKLQKNGLLELRAETDPEGKGLAVSILRSGDVRLDREAGSARRLLELPEDVEVFHVTSGRVRKSTDEVAMLGRSLLGVLFFLSQAVEAPRADSETGRVAVTVDADGRPFDWRAAMTGMLRIRSQAERPAGAFVRVEYRGHWFFIDDTDLESKTTFGLLTYLFSLQSTRAPSSGPLLTISADG